MKGQRSRRFLFRLALALGRTIEELDATLSAQEFAEWIAYDAVEPIGGTRGDLHAGIIASTIANVNRSRKTKAFKPTDFMPLRDGDDERVAQREVAVSARGFFDNYRARHRAKQEEA